MVGGDRITRLCRDVVSGRAKEDCVRDDEEAEAWDDLVEDVAKIHAKGGIVDIPWDWAAD